MIELMRFITREGEEFWLHAEKRPFWIVVEMCPVVSWTVRPIPPDPRTRGVIEHRFRLVHRQVKLMGGHRLVRLLRRGCTGKRSVRC